MRKELEQQELLRIRKLKIWLPVAVVPLLVLVFVALGGGKGVEGAAAAGMIKGVNMSLPLANLDVKKGEGDKMAIYKRAAQDSLKCQEQMKQDPYAAKVDIRDSVRLDNARTRSLSAVHLAADRQADSLSRRLVELRNLVGASGGKVPKVAPEVIRRPDEVVRSSAERLDRLRELLGGGGGQAEGAGGPPNQRMGRFRELLSGERRITSTPDPEMERIDGMLDKLLKIQHPEGGQGPTSPVAVRRDLAVLEVPRQDMIVNTLGVEGGEPGGFMEIRERGVDDSLRDHASTLKAVVSVDQTIVAGSGVTPEVRLELSQEAVLAGHRVPMGQSLAGVASLSGERLMITVSSIRVGAEVFPVSLQVYDLDGVPGIRVPGALTRDVAKASADEAIGGAQLGVINPSIGGQAANAGIQLARSLASRKVRLVRVSVPSGYQVLLKNIKI